MKKKVILLAVGLAISNAVIASPHKCEINGKVIFQDAPCAGEVKRSEAISETGARELFDKFSISEIKVSKGKKGNEMTQIFYEITAINQTNNQVFIQLVYDGIDKNDLSIDSLATGSIVDRNATKKIRVTTFKRNGTLENVEKYKLRSWKSSLS